MTREIAKSYSMGEGYSYEIDRVTEKEWYDILRKFDDATIYQTWAYGKVRWGEKNISHLILKKNGRIVAASQARIIKLKPINVSIAYIHRGPLWRIKGEKPDKNNFRQILKALKIEYLKIQKSSLRFVPQEIDENSASLISIITELGFKKNKTISPYRTLLIDLSLSLENLRKNLKKDWRKNLNRSEKFGVKIKEGTSLQLYDIFTNLYKEMHQRKNFVEFVDIGEFREIQKQLPDEFKLRISLAFNQEEPIAALTYSAIGDTGITIFSATNKAGHKFKGAHALRWKMLEYLKNHNFKYLDQGGIDPQKNPGGYQYKMRFGGQDIRFLGHFEAYPDIFSQLLIKSAEFFRNTYRNLKILFNQLVHRKF